MAAVVLVRYVVITLVRIMVITPVVVVFRRVYNVNNIYLIYMGGGNANALAFQIENYLAFWRVHA